jgi:hypothetical protein
LKGEIMKVLEKGSWDVPWSIEVKCPENSCGAKLLVEEGDVKPVDYGSGYYADCMICEHRVDISARDIPLRVKRPLDKKRKYSSSWD